MTLISVSAVFSRTLHARQRVHLPDFADTTALMYERMASLPWLGLTRVAMYNAYMEMVCPHEDGYPMAMVDVVS